MIAYRLETDKPACHRGPRGRAPLDRACAGAGLGIGRQPHPHPGARQRLRQGRAIGRAPPQAGTRGPRPRAAHRLGQDAEPVAIDARPAQRGGPRALGERGWLPSPRWPLAAVYAGGQGQEQGRPLASSWAPSPAALEARVPWAACPAGPRSAPPALPGWGSAPPRSGGEPRRGCPRPCTPGGPGLYRGRHTRLAGAGPAAARGPAGRPRPPVARSLL